MNIGITCYPTYGGSGTVATELGKNLARRGDTVHFVTTAMPYRLSEFIENVHFHEVQVFNYPLFDYVPYTLSLASQMAQTAIKEHLDLFHVHYAVPHATAGYLAARILEKKGRRLPIITTLHGTDIMLVGTDPSYYEITKFSIDESDAVTAVSEYLMLQTRKNFGTEMPIHVIPNFVDTERFIPSTTVCRSMFADPGEKILMHISNFRSVKRIQDIVLVFEEVARRMPARLVLIGNGPEREPIARMVEERGLGDRVRFMDRQVDVSRLIPLADVYLLLSEHESFGLTALEAMSCGVPVVGTSGSGMDEFLGDGVAGSLFPVGDVPAIAEGVAHILGDTELARAMGEAGRDRAITRYSEDLIIGRYTDLYREVLSR